MMSTQLNSADRLESPDKSNLLGLLRFSTRDVHEALHVHPVLACLTSDTLDRAGYLRALKGFYGFHVPVERQLNALSLPDFPGLTASLATEALQHDLAYWNIDPDTIPVFTCDPITEEDAVAYLYLREGSTLGGQQIARNVRKVLDLQDDGVRFFAGRGRETGIAWKNFCAQLDQSARRLDHGIVAASASHRFTALGAWLGRNAF